MKLLFVNATGAIGGGEKVLLMALAAIRQARPTAQCYLLSLAPGPLIERAAELGVQASVLPAPAGLNALGDSQVNHSARRALQLLSILWQSTRASWQMWRYARQLRRKIREIGPDLIHSNGIKTHLLLWLAGTGKTPVLWHMHDFMSRRSLVRRLLGRAIKPTTRAVAISQAVADDVRRLWPRLPVSVVANAIDTAWFCPGPAEPGLLDRLAGLPPRECLRVGLVATYARWKGHGVFLEAAARLLREHTDMAVRFFIVGGPIYHTRGSQYERGELEQLADRLGIRAAVGFIDFQLDLRPVYRSLDVVVHASTAPEPFGLTIIEAMACGKAVVAVSSGGAAEIFRSGHDALGVPLGDAEALANSIHKLLSDGSLRDSLGVNARQTACERFDQQRFGRELRQLYEIVLGEPSSELTKITLSTQNVEISTCTSTDNIV